MRKHEGRFYGEAFREDIISYTEPKFGYTREAPGFQRFVNVLMNMNGDERKV